LTAKKGTDVDNENNLCMVKEQFLHPEYKDMILIKDNAADMLDSLVSFQLPYIEKWRDLKRI